MIKKIKHHNDRNNITKIRFFNVFDIGWYVTRNMGIHKVFLE